MFEFIGRPFTYKEKQVIQRNIDLLQREINNLREINEKLREDYEKLKDEIHMNSLKEGCHETFYKNLHRHDQRVVFQEATELRKEHEILWKKVKTIEDYLK